MRLRHAPFTTEAGFDRASLARAWYDYLAVEDNRWGFYYDVVATAVRPPRFVLCLHFRFVLIEVLRNGE